MASLPSRRRSAAPLLAAGLLALVATSARAQPGAPELVGISTGDYELNAALTPDGRTIYYTKSTFGFVLMTIVSSEWTGEGWSLPAVASFSGRFSDADPFVTSDGNQLYFISNRPTAPDDSATEFNLWRVRREGGGWGAPEVLPEPVNGPGDDFYVTVARSGALYFSSQREGGPGRFDLYRAVPDADGGYTVEALPPTVNTELSEIDVYVDPDERYIVFAAYGRPDGLGNGDLYLSERTAEGWTPARNLGPGVNTSAREYCPIGSPDGQHFYFTSERLFTGGAPLAHPLTGAELVERLRRPGNGAGDVYRVPVESLGLPDSDTAER
jgi:hypothetical protein